MTTRLGVEDIDFFPNRRVLFFKPGLTTVLYTTVQVNFTRMAGHKGAGTATGRDQGQHTKNQTEEQLH